jgi:hypothetical protein
MTSGQKPPSSKPGLRLALPVALKDTARGQVLERGSQVHDRRSVYL